MTSPRTEYDVIVIGAGIEGSSCAYNLVQEGKGVLLLEQFPLPHSRGSSHGQSRITRYAYEDEFYVRMMVDAFPLWEQLEKEAGTEFFVNCGVLDLRTNDSPGLNRVLTSLRALNVPHERLSSRDIARRFPTILARDDDEAIYDPSGGLLRADKALRAYQEVFKSRGGVLQDNEPVTSITPGDVVNVVTTKSTYNARQVVLAAGPWAEKLCSSLGLILPLVPKRISVYYWKTSDELTPVYGTQHFPCFIDYRWGDSVLHSYSLPVSEYPGLLKVCIHDGARIDPDERDRGASDTWIESSISHIVATTFKGLEITPSIKEYCIYTVTPDHHPFIDRHPRYSNIVIAAGFSGHGFKLAPAVGRAVADLVCQRKPRYDLSPFKVDRFQRKSSL
jgi:sarcosine oxidase/L-pipecolate oxidase